MRDDGWIGVSLEGTLSFYDHWRGSTHIGSPIALTIKRIKSWLKQGREVRIVTPRANPAWSDYGIAVAAIELWCEELFGEVLPVTNCIDLDMIELWSANAVQTDENTGIPVELR